MPRKRSASDQGKPSRPLSAYNYFFHDERNAIIQDVEQGLRTKPAFADMSKFIGNKWKQVSDGQRAHYQEMAARDKRRYALELVQWRQRQHQEHCQQEEGKDPFIESGSDQSETNVGNLTADGSAAESAASQHPLQSSGRNRTGAPLVHRSPAQYFAAGNMPSQQQALHLPLQLPQNPMVSSQAHGSRLQQLSGISMGCPAFDTGLSVDAFTVEPRPIHASAFRQQDQGGFGSLAWVAQELGEDGVEIFVNLFRDG